MSSFNKSLASCWIPEHWNEELAHIAERQMSSKSDVMRRALGLLFEAERSNQNDKRPLRWSV
jgi:hypothetical protein